MKKWLCLILALVMVLSFTACDDDDSSKRNDDDEEEAATMYSSTVSFKASDDRHACAELMKTQDYYEWIAETAGRDVTADDVEQMLLIDVVDSHLSVTITHEAPRTIQAVRMAVLDETEAYIQQTYPDISLEASAVSDIEKGKETDGV